MGINASSSTPRVLIAKPGLDGHDRGAKVITLALRDAGMEVIYTGLHQTPMQIAAVAAQEDVDVVGLSVLSGVHLELTQQLFAEMAKRGIDDKIVLVGGTIPSADIPKLEALGARKVFPVHSRTSDIVEFIRNAVAEAPAAALPGDLGLQRGEKLICE